MIYRRAVVAHLVVQGPKREMDKRRCSLHFGQEPFAPRYRFLDLKSVPPAFVVAQDVVSRQVKFKDLARLVPRAGRKDLPQKIGENSEEKYYEHRKPRYREHRRNYAERKEILPL